MVIVLPASGSAKIKSVLSGDTVVLLGKAAGGGKAPEVTFTFERVTAPRMASKANSNVDDPAAFSSREWLRNMCVGKTVTFETRKQGASAGDRVYGLLSMPNPTDSTKQWNLSVESVRRGFCTPKVLGAADSTTDNGDTGDSVEDYESALQSAYKEAVAAKVGVHSATPLVRKLMNAGDEFQAMTLVEKAKRICTNGTVMCVIEYVFDGSRFRCIVTDPELESAGLLYGSFTLILAGVACPRVGNPRLNPPTPSEPCAEAARDFVELRLLQRELKVTLHGTDKSGVCLVGTVHHPRGNIAAEVLKNGLGRISDWTTRMMNPGDVPPLRFAENGAKRANLGVFESYKPPTLTGASEFIGTVVEVISGDTLMILPNGETYDDESKLKKVSLASIRAPRAGNERTGKEDEPYASECKDRLRILTVGKSAKVNVHYEKEIPMGKKTEKRQFGTISVGKRDDIGEVLITEGHATTQRHRDDDEKSARYDELVAAENIAKAAGKGVHSDKEYKKKTVNDLADPKKAKTYAGAMQRAGQTKAIVDYVFNGSRMKLFVPSENCYIMFALGNVRCPQPSPNPGAVSRGTARPAEPFGDASKRHSRMTVNQRSVEITCTGVTQGGVMTGDLYVGQGGQRRDYAIELVASGLATVDQRKIDYGEAPKLLVDSQTAAQKNKLGLWSVKQVKKDEPKAVKTFEKADERLVDIQISEICSGNHFFFRTVGDESAKVIDDSMKIFTEQNGSDGAPCEVKPGKIVAALFNDGSTSSWYRAKVMEKAAKGKVKVLFVDHGNTAAVPAATHLRPLDATLGTDQIPAAAKEAVLVLTKVRPLEDDDGIDAARMFQGVAWGKDLKARFHGEAEGQVLVTLYDPADESTSINEKLTSDGLALLVKGDALYSVMDKAGKNDSLGKLMKDLKSAQDKARKSRKGIWIYGEIGDDDPETI